MMCCSGESFSPVECLRFLMNVLQARALPSPLSTQEGARQAYGIYIAFHWQSQSGVKTDNACSCSLSNAAPSADIIVTNGVHPRVQNSIRNWKQTVRYWTSVSREATIDLVFKDSLARCKFCKNLFLHFVEASSTKLEVPLSSCFVRAKTKNVI